MEYTRKAREVATERGRATSTKRVLNKKDLDEKEKKIYIHDKL